MSGVSWKREWMRGTWWQSDAVILSVVDSSWNVMAHGDARQGKWRGNWRMEWVASTLHTTSELGVSSITTADVHTSAASSRLNWRPRWFKWTRPFRRKTKSGFCACAITFKLASAAQFFGARGNLSEIPPLTEIIKFKPITVICSIFFYLSQ
jgi:hypothetical protein